MTQNQDSIDLLQEIRMFRVDNFYELLHEKRHLTCRFQPSFWGWQFLFRKINILMFSNSHCGNANRLRFILWGRKSKWKSEEKFPPAE
jgi:hypothetical protein